AMSKFASDSAHTDDPLGWPANACGTCVLGDDTPAEYLQLSENWVIAKTDFPGHTQIGVAYLVGKLDDNNALKPSAIRYAFLGDMILMGGIGRTDFPCSSTTSMYQSLQRLPRLIDDFTLICPTHDYNFGLATTLKTEIAENDFLHSIIKADVPMSLDQFLKMKPTIDAEIADETNSELVCGMINKAVQACDVSLRRDELNELLESDTDHLIIDVREPHEFRFQQGWDELGFREIPRNVPLTRLSDFLPELLEDYADPQRMVVFLCRSGSRSGKAAEVARRLGIKNARSVVGGLALNTLHCSASAAVELEYEI
ncbi:MAG: rhodanese-like domain-containing protein, partial [Planctomycetota bacterium]